MGEATDTGESRIRKWLTGLQFSQLWQLVVLVVLGGTALFGGLDTVDTRIHAAEVGTAFSDGQFTITVERASLIRELRVGNRPVLPPQPGQRYLGVVAVLRNDGTGPGTLDNQLRLQGVPDAKPETARRVRDGEPVTSIGAGLTEQLVFVWTVPENVLAQGDSVTLRIDDKKYTELLTTYGKAWVHSATDYTRVTVPVRDKT